MSDLLEGPLLLHDAPDAPLQVFVQVGESVPEALLLRHHKALHEGRPVYIFEEVKLEPRFLVEELDFGIVVVAVNVLHVL